MDDLRVALKAAAAGAAVIAEHFGTGVAPEWKGEVDPVTAVDREAEAAALAVIREHRPDDAILAEESGGEDWDEGRVWIVDPLDGTVNFVHAFPQVATSVGLRENGAGVVGVVSDVIHEEVFSARTGGGAFLNGERIRVSEQTDPARCLIGTGFSYERQRRAQEMANTLAGVLQTFQGIRRVGSAALDLCWVAAGRLDAYWEYGLRPWDSAAGTLIVTEAGGRVSTFDGSPYPLDDPGVVASNGHVHDALLEAIAR